MFVEGSATGRVKFRESGTGSPSAVSLTPRQQPSATRDEMWGSSSLALLLVQVSLREVIRNQSGCHRRDIGKRPVQRKVAGQKCEEIVSPSPRPHPLG
jgi:hypothetical protein